MQIGPRILVVSCKLPYPGWKQFKEEISGCLKAIIGAGAIGVIERMGLRYINLFVGDITEQLTVKIMSTTGLSSETMSLRMAIEHNGLMNSVGIHTEINNAGETKDQPGTVVDIDTFVNLNVEVRDWGYAEILEQMHETEKSLFFSLLQKTLLQLFNPTYHD